MTPPAPRVVVVGDAMMDVTVRIESDIVYASDTPAHISLQPGGSGSNTAAWLGASGVPVTYVGAVGADPYGAALLRSLRGFSVDCRVLESPDRGTGTCVVIVDGSAERTMFPDAGANSLLSESQVTEAITADVSYLHLSGYTLLNPASRGAGLAALAAARAAGVPVSLDPASAGPLETNRDLMLSVLDQVDVLFANAAEAAVLVGNDDPHRALVMLGGIVPTVIVKMGARGALLSHGPDLVELPAVPVDAIDTTGAGDAFTAGFLRARLSGGSMTDALRSGLDLGARAVSRVGAGPPEG